VTFTLDDKSTYTKTLDLQPVSHDEVDENGKQILVFVDPMDDVKTHLSNFALAYQEGKSKQDEESKEVDSALVGKSITVKVDEV
jgi:hypothetical protein